MSFVNRGGLAALFLLLTVGACVVPLMPNMPWAKNGGKTVNPWVNCNVTANGSQSCTDIMSVFNVTGFNAAKGERDGSLAGLMLGGLLAVFGILAVCCNKKGAVIGLSVTSFIFCAAAVGCFATFKLMILDSDDIEYAWDYGFGIAVGAVAFSMMASAAACCMQKHQEYFQIA